MLTYFIVYDLSDDTRILDTETFTEKQWFVEFIIRIYVLGSAWSLVAL